MTTTTEKSNDRCHTCGQTRAWHHENTPRHSFNNGELPAAATFGVKLPGGGRGPGPSSQDGGEAVVVEAQWPFDPVLRMALIDKGILSPEDLSEAERKIRSVTASMTQEVKDVPGTNGSGQPDV